MGYLKEKAAVPYEIMVFTDRKAAADFIKSNETEILLTGDEEIISKGKEYKVHKILKLSEEQIEKNIEESEEFHPIFKYQSTENIIKEMLCYCSGSICRSKEGIPSHTKGHIFGVYSPAGRCCKTAFSLALANALGKNARVLYINLEEYTGLSDTVLRRENGSLSDLMYMYRRGTAGLKSRIGNCTVSLGKFDYIPPVECPEDVVDVLPEEWSTFFEYIIENMDYDFLVIDIGNLVKRTWYFLEIMDIVFMPEAVEYMSENKINEFIRDMNNMGRGILLENIVMINIPYDEEMDKGILSIEQIEWSIIGSFARKVINERGF